MAASRRRRRRRGPSSGAQWTSDSGISAARREIQGSSTLPLDAAALAHSQGPSRSFADVRDRGRQQRADPVPARTPRPTTVAGPRAAAGDATGAGAAGSARPSVVLRDHAAIRGSSRCRLELQTSGAVFRRFVQLGVERPPDRRRRETAFEQLTQAVVATQRPVCHAAAARARAAVRALARAAADRRRRRQQAAAADGDQTAASRMAAAVPSPAGPVETALWERDIGNPRYDVAVLAPSVMTGAAREAVAEPERAPAQPAAIVSPRAFWAGLAVAVVLLLGVLVRLISSGTAPPPSRPGP